AGKAIIRAPMALAATRAARRVRERFTSTGNLTEVVGGASVESGIWPSLIVILANASKLAVAGWSQNSTVSYRNDTSYVSSDDTRRNVPSVTQVNDLRPSSEYSLAKKLTGILADC